MNDSPGADHAFYFPESGGPLFGYYHPPLRPNAQAASVVLCQPVGHEYIRAHRTFRQLAIALARAGFPVLRFDYSGTGDSAGDPADGGIPEWLRDVHAASREGRRRSGRERTCFVGARLGATLAFLAAAREGFADRVVLWDPVIRGRDHLRELSDTHQAHLRLLPGWTSSGNGSPAAVEYMGFPYSTALRQQIEKLDIATWASPCAPRTLLLETEPSATSPRLLDLCGAEAAQMTYRAVPGPRVWAQGEFRLLVPHPSIFDEIAAWLGAIPR
jgi:alpha/beta superfamily hydrolase